LVGVVGVEDELAAPGAEEVRASDALRNATPPPGRIPSSTAARIALRASS